MARHEEQPPTLRRVFRSATVGDNTSGGIAAMTLPGGRIRGVIVDNPSGSWVRLDGAGLDAPPYIQPYTLAWSVSLLPSVDELSASYAVGPTGQPIKIEGSPLVVYLFDVQVPASGGSQFFTSGTGLQSGTVFTSTSATPGTFGGTTVIAAPGAGFRLRVIACHALYFGPSAANGWVSVNFLDNLPQASLGGCGLSWANPADRFFIPDPGFPLTPNSGVATSDVANSASQVYRAVVYYYTDKV